MAVAEQVPPSVVWTWLEKNYLSSYSPRGVNMYLLAVARETVDS
jgi:hypothetical protein